MSDQVLRTEGIGRAASLPMRNAGNISAGEEAHLLHTGDATELDVPWGPEGYRSVSPLGGSVDGLDLSDRPVSRLGIIAGRGNLEELLISRIHVLGSRACATDT